MKHLLIILCITLPAFCFAQEEFEITEGDTTYTMKKYFLCILKKGPRQEMDSMQIALIQEQHMAHLTMLDKAGKISMAGPIEDDLEIRGIVVYNVATMEEALKLAREDPAVRAGRLKVEMHPWWAVKGSRLK